MKLIHPLHWLPLPVWLAWLFYVPNTMASVEAMGPRRVISLDGQWQIAQGNLTAPPTAYRREVPVPGLVDLTQPAFSEVGQKSAQRQAFWYRRTFTVPGAIPEIVILKIHKVRYGAQVWLNGHCVGDHLPCFTPAYLPVRDYVQGNRQANELLIRVGADFEALPPDMPNGWDFEKYRYLPGIYDSVELILAHAPYLVNVQTVPDIKNHQVRVVAEVASGAQAAELVLRGQVKSVKSKHAAGPSISTKTTLRAHQQQTVELNIPIDNCRLWSPEDPFLYALELSTGADAIRVRFGMRSFSFDPTTKRALLNGRTYYLRGSNVTIYRFFEDAERGELPWDPRWVRKLHRQFKSMNWNALRYCIGFPPEFWYDIADEEGLLIQDEFPIWTLSRAPYQPVAAKIIPEYEAWMRERWNHACVVIWDAQNESVTTETGQALQAVRHLDLSHRPWENGWGTPQSPTDCVEAHPYLFIRDWNSTNRFRMSELATLSGVPYLNNEQKQLPVAIIINEYAWLWLTRDGHPTCLTDQVYAHLLGPNSTVSTRRQLYARYLAALTEFWRAHRECAGVLHFCGLGYSRPGDKPRPEGGATSDHWLDLHRLKFEPDFETYVKDAFNPVGIMLDFWAEEIAVNSRQDLKVSVLNDLDQAWNGQVQLGAIYENHFEKLQVKPIRVPALGRATLHFEQAMPAVAGRYTLVAELKDHRGRVIRSLRDVQLK